MRNKNKTSYICTIKILKYNFMENWKDIKGCEGLYKVSSYGRIMTVRKNAILCPAKTISNGLTVSLSKNGKVEKRQVSRLVAAAFIPNPENKPCVDHIDGDKSNNRADNLRWVTTKENCNNPITKSRLNKKIGEYMVGRLGGLHQRAKQIAMYSICGDLIKTFLSVKDAQRETGLNDSNIVKCCKGIKKTCGGYIWAYV